MFLESAHDLGRALGFDARDLPEHAFDGLGLVRGEVPVGVGHVGEQPGERRYDRDRVRVRLGHCPADDLSE
jgi:hypothetical protein